ncbi:hypothetical protein LZG00_13510 [Rhodobacteraceae bacterium LMO-12]|nr:hypothetical protein [Rhodobacteraceae bacterium LMO-JJ12]
MYHGKITAETHTNAQPNRDIGLCRFLSEHSEDLANSAALLAGGKGACIVREILDGLANQMAITRRLRTRMFDLLDILTLRNVHDDNRVEAACFAMIDPSEPMVDDICLLADGLDDALRGADIFPASDGRAA